MIRLTVRAFSELLQLPAYAQSRILYEQKYPRRQPQAFKIPYYQTALGGIRDYYRTGRDASALTRARNKASVLSQDARRIHNVRVIDAFEGGAQFNRNLQLLSMPTYIAEPVPGLELRLRFDAEALERNRKARIFYNLRNTELDDRTARATLQIAQWVLEENGQGDSIRSLDYVDFMNGSVHSVSRQSQRTIRLMEANSEIIMAIWPTI